MTSTVLSGLEPAAVFHWFEQISAIPRGSGHTAAISQFCVDFAAQRGLRCCRTGPTASSFTRTLLPAMRTTPP